MQKFVLVGCGLYLQIIGIGFAVASNNTLGARIAFGSAVLALCATALALKRCISSIKEVGCA